MPEIQNLITSQLNQAIDIRAGNLTPANGGMMNIQIYAGYGATGSDGGQVNLAAGFGDVSGVNTDGGRIDLYGGSASGDGGAIDIYTSGGSSGEGGPITITTGPGDSAIGGNITITSGTGGTGASGGDITLQSGYGSEGLYAPAYVSIRGGDGPNTGAGQVEINSFGQNGNAGEVLVSSGNATTHSNNGVAWGGVITAAGAPSGQPDAMLPFAFDTTAVTGGFYYWNGSSWVKIATIL
jgi:hypothetical protein